VIRRGSHSHFVESSTTFHISKQPSDRN
jgi:hypothetical protein